ncbi:MAG: aldo/keto reductase [Gemmatimonadetes bacterium]|nr:aldo/keto reductase [Gemmatimonadota bacterium]
MKYTRMGATGTQVSRICMGCMTFGNRDWVPWVLGAEDAGPHFEKAIELGINFFDTANIYSKGISEEITGKWLRKLLPNREEYVLATKVFFPMSEHRNDGGLSRKHIIAQCDASLARLGVDYIDLYQIHRWDPDTPLEESLEALDSLVRSGKVRYLGASSMAGWQFAKALFVAGVNGWHQFVTMQNHYNLIYREEEREMIPLCNDQGVGLLPWSPLARGFLAGTWKKDGGRETPRAKSDAFAEKMYGDGSDWDVLDALLAVAKERGESPARVALAWLLTVPAVTAPIIGATKIEHLEDLCKGVDIELSGDEIAALEAPYQPKEILGHQQPGARD